MRRATPKALEDPTAAVTLALVAEIPVVNMEVQVSRVPDQEVKEPSPSRMVALTLRVVHKDGPKISSVMININQINKEDMDSILAGNLRNNLDGPGISSINSVGTRV